MARLKEIVIDADVPLRLARFREAALDGYAVRPYDEAEIARLAQTLSARRRDTRCSTIPKATIFA